MDLVMLVNDELANVEYWFSLTANKDRDEVIAALVHMMLLNPYIHGFSPKVTNITEQEQATEKLNMTRRSVKSNTKRGSADSWLLHVVKISAFLLFIMGALHVGKTKIFLMTLAVAMLCKVLISSGHLFSENPTVNSNPTIRGTTTIKTTPKDIDGLGKELGISEARARSEMPRTRELVCLQAPNTITSSRNNNTSIQKSKKLSCIKTTNVGDISPSSPSPLCSLSSSSIADRWSMLHGGDGTSTPKTPLRSAQQQQGKTKKYKSLLKYIKTKEKVHHTTRVTSAPTLRPSKEIHGIVSSIPNSSTFMVRPSSIDQIQQTRSIWLSSPTLLRPSSISRAPKVSTNEMEGEVQTRKKRSPGIGKGIRGRGSRRWSVLLGFAVSVVGVVMGEQSVAVVGLVCFWYATGILSQYADPTVQIGPLFPDLAGTDCNM